MNNSFLSIKKFYGRPHSITQSNQNTKMKANIIIKTKYKNKSKAKCYKIVKICKIVNNPRSFVQQLFVRVFYQRKNTCERENMMLVILNLLRYSISLSLVRCKFWSKTKN